MKEIFKSKVMILFMVVVLGITYVSSNINARLDENNKPQKIVANV